LLVISALLGVIAVGALPPTLNEKDAIVPEKQFDAPSSALEQSRWPWSAPPPPPPEGPNPFGGTREKGYYEMDETLRAQRCSACRLSVITKPAWDEYDPPEYSGKCFCNGALSGDCIADQKNPTQRPTRCVPKN
jgi:hypothetical protein